MKIEGSVALVTGSNRGLGAAFVKELLERGAAKVYAAARAPRSSDDPRIVPLRLDVTDVAQVAAAAEVARDVTLVVNNAGSHSGASIIDGPFEGIQSDLDTNFFGLRPAVPLVEVVHCHQAYEPRWIRFLES